jgi:hypothetical protein
MEKRKDISELRQEASQFLDCLSKVDLSNLLDSSAFGSSVLECAINSESLTHKIDGILDAEYQKMTEDQQQRLKHLVARLT